MSDSITKVDNSIFEGQTLSIFPFVDDYFDDSLESEKQFSSDENLSEYLIVWLAFELFPSLLPLD